MQTRSVRRILIILLAIVAVSAPVIYLITLPGEDGGPLSASGSVEAVEIKIASELSGRVKEVFVEDGSLVQQGDPLFKLDDELLQAQRDRAVLVYENSKINLDAAKAAVESAEAGLNVSRISADTVKTQYQLTLASARLTEMPVRRGAWKITPPSAFTLPVWYFPESAELSSAEVEVDSAFEALETELMHLEELLQEFSDLDLPEIESRLLDAQTAYLITEDVLDRAKDQDDEELEQIAQSSFDNAESELEAAQEAYEDLLSDEQYDEVLEARARVALAQERYETALDHFHQLQTGEFSLQVQAAEIALDRSQASIDLAEAQLAQAQVNQVQVEKSIEQALAEINVIDIQINKLMVTSPTNGIVRSRNIEPGEVIQAGATAITIDRSDTLTITVYIPEDQYGVILLGSHAQVSVDSFPDEVFDAVITRIADRAEFTPRNVQTEEGRRSTVFAVQLSVEDDSGKLKPGMPADVTFR